MRRGKNEPVIMKIELEKSSIKLPAKENEDQLPFTHESSCLSGITNHYDIHKLISPGLMLIETQIND